MAPRLSGSVRTPDDQVPRAEDRLRSLLAANAAIASDLSLPVLLHRIVDAARDLVGARYAALGVVGRHGELEEFVHAGIADDDVRRIGHRDHHPPMSRFLGVPIRVRGVQFGTLYLTEPTHDASFTADDEAVVVALAATAGVAIENARLYDESEQRRRWLSASGDVTRLLLSVAEPETDQLIVDAVSAAAEADVAFLARPIGDDQMVINAVGGALAAGFRGRVVDVSGALSGQVFGAGMSVLSLDELLREAAGAVHGEDGPAVGVPLVVGGVVIGALCVVRHPDRRPYSRTDLDMIEGFAGQVTLALELGRARAAQQELNRLADRDRIARDLHDHVIQELYALGMGLQQMIPATVDAQRAARLDAFVDTVDATIRRIRTTIFDLTPLDHDATGLQAQILDVVDQQSGALGFRPAVTFTGPLDVVHDAAFTGDVLAVVREALSNCARHAGAHRAQVSVTLLGDVVTVEVADDGRGVEHLSSRSSGLANLHHRARTHEGDLTLTEATGGGALMTWTARWTTRTPA